MASVFPLEFFSDGQKKPVVQSNFFLLSYHLLLPVIIVMVVVMCRHSQAQSFVLKFEALAEQVDSFE